MTLWHRAGKEKHDTSLREKYNMTRNTFVFDSGATSHRRFSKDGTVNLKPLKIDSKVGNAEDIYSEAIGTFKGLVTQKDGSTFPLIIEDVLYFPDLYINLFSMTPVLNNKTVDFKREKGTIALIYDKDHKILFDKIIEVGCGKLLGVDIVPHQENLNRHIRSYKDSTPKPCENCACAKIKIKNFPKEPTSFLAKEKGDRIMFDISSFNSGY
jgi:hypothetical protein